MGCSREARVPDVVNHITARHELERAGYVYKEELVEGHQTDCGLFGLNVAFNFGAYSPVAQSPSPGTPLAKGETVTIYLDPCRTDRGGGNLQPNQ